MSKNTLLSLGLLLLAGALIVLKPVIFPRIDSHQSEDTVTQAPQLQSNNSSNIFSEEVEYQGSRYNVIGFIVDDPEKLNLYPNFAEKLTSAEAMKEYGCSLLSSGGLYTKDSIPIGLFISEGRQLKSMVKDEFYNGIFSLFYDKRVEIGDSFSKGEVRIALQSGPLLMQDGLGYNFEDRSKEEARRVVIGLTNDSKIIFMVIYKEESVFLGPTLDVLPQLLLDFSGKSGMKIISALNLDGGSASAFKSSNSSLSELTPVGSYFCVE